MRVEDAPPPGWYPDPQGGARLRWWEGTDWSDRYRSPPTPGVEELRRGFEQAAHAVEHRGAGYGVSRQETDEIIHQVRMAARAEIDRAADVFGRRAAAATSNLTPLIEQYTNKAVTWFKRIAVFIVLLLIAWVAFQIFAQASLFEWIGDRIDNLVDRINDDSG